jgi:hypothetical protein
VRVGMLVPVNEGDRDPHLRGQVGTVIHRYGNVSHAAFDVQFDNGRSELFWHHELEEAQAPSAGF